MEGLLGKKTCFFKHHKTHLCASKPIWGENLEEHNISSLKIYWDFWKHSKIDFLSFFFLVVSFTPIVQAMHFK